ITAQMHLQYESHCKIGASPRIGSCLAVRPLTARLRQAPPPIGGGAFATGCPYCYREPQPVVYVGAAVATSHHIGVVRSSEPCRATAASTCDALTEYSVLEYSNRRGTMSIIASGPGFTVFGTHVRRHSDRFAASARMNDTSA